MESVGSSGCQVPPLAWDWSSAWLGILFSDSSSGSAGADAACGSVSRRARSVSIRRNGGLDSQSRARVSMARRLAGKIVKLAKVAR